MAKRAGRLFLVERYVPVGSPQAVDFAARIAEAEAALSRQGRDVTWLHSLVLPDDEEWLCLFSASAVADVLEVNRIAGLSFEAVLHAQLLLPSGGCIVRGLPVEASGVGRPESKRRPWD
jgi:hypothetical protein